MVVGKKRKGRKKSEEEKEILSRLKTLEKSISELRNSLTKVNESSFLKHEDQLFFSFVFSMALLAITIPSLDVTTLFESFGVKLELPEPSILSTKILVTALLIVSSALRYIVSTLKESSENRNKLRAWSVKLLLLSLYFLILELFIRGLGTFLQQINVFLLLLPPILIMISSHFIGKAERKWLQLYESNEQQISFVFFGVGLCILIIYDLGMFASIFVPLSSFVIGFLIVISFILTIIILRFYAKFL